MEEVSREIKVLPTGKKRSIINSGAIGIKDGKSLSHKIRMSEYITESPQWSLQVLSNPIEILTKSISLML